MVRTVCSRSPTPVPASQPTSCRTCSSGSGAAVLPAAAAAPASASRWCTRWSPRTAAPSPLPVLPTAAPGSPCGSRPQTRSRSATAARALRPWAEQPLDADLGAGGEAVATVLVVEDERKLRELLRSYLEHDGLTVLSTASGAEAIRLTRDTAPNLLVLDLRLPRRPRRRGCPRGSAVFPRPDPRAHRQDRDRRSDPLPRARGRRLRHQTVQPARGHPAGPRHLAPRSFRSGRRRPDLVRRRRGSSSMSLAGKPSFAATRSSSPPPSGACSPPSPGHPAG